MASISISIHRNAALLLILILVSLIAVVSEVVHVSAPASEESINVHTRPTGAVVVGGDGKGQRTPAAVAVSDAIRNLVVSAWESIQTSVRTCINGGVDDTLVTPLLRKGESVTRIAFGSCGKPELRGGDMLWESVVLWRPEVWLWLGDNIYADERYFDDDADGPASLRVRLLRGIGDVASLAIPELYLKLIRRALGIRKTKTRWVGEQRTLQMYQEQLNVPGYKKLLERGVAIAGIYDDHDYGLNDAGKEFSAKVTTKRLALDFLAEPRASKRWRRSGAYASYLLGEVKGRRVRVVLLDTRYNRDRLDSDGTMLGEEQWEWLERIFAARHDAADITLIGTSIQFVGGVDLLMRPLMRSEGWVRFPTERRKVMRLLAKYKVPGVIFLSGDVHLGTITDLAAADRCGVPYSVLDATSSGLTHSALALMPFSIIAVASLFAGITVPGFIFPPGSAAASDVFLGLNWGSVEIDWDATPSPSIVVAVRDSHGRARVKKAMHLHSLQYSHEDGGEYESNDHIDNAESASCTVTAEFAHLWQVLWALVDKVLILMSVICDVSVVYAVISIVRKCMYRSRRKNRDIC